MYIYPIVKAVFSEKVANFKDKIAVPLPNAIVVGKNLVGERFLGRVWLLQIIPGVLQVKILPYS